MIYESGMKKQILILGGSSEAFALDEALYQSNAYNITTSLAGRTSLPRKPKGAYRTGGFGGAEGLAHYLQSEKFDAIIDATHPFAARITENARIAAEISACPLLHIWRQPWQKSTGDHWIEVADMQAAASALTEEMSPAFLTIGRLELDAFLNRPEINFITRAIEPAKATDPAGLDAAAYPENFSFIYEKGPFTLARETDLITRYGIRAIVTKNSGGPGASAKLIAAREQGLPVIMVNRPPEPLGDKVSTAEEAMLWLTTLFQEQE